MNYIRPLYWLTRRILFKNIFVSKYIFNKQLKNINNNLNCPICNCGDIYNIYFNYEKKEIIKYYCGFCEHIFSKNLNADFNKGNELFNYSQENNHIKDQIHLLETMVKKTGKKRNGLRKFLDYGIGGNYSHLNKLNSKYNNVYFYGCDIYPSKRGNYFTCHQDSSFNGLFDGISSNAVIEHLDNTIYSWQYFNKLLKSKDEGIGIMMHSFPSQITEDMLHWTIRIQSHECLFSKKSLKIVCDKTGFKLIRISSNYKVQHPIYIFEKVKDL